MLKRRRFKQQFSLRDRLIAWAAKLREQAAKLPPGAQREQLLSKAHQAETTSGLDSDSPPPNLPPSK